MSGRVKLSVVGHRKMSKQLHGKELSVYQSARRRARRAECGHKSSTGLPLASSNMQLHCGCGVGPDLPTAFRPCFTKAILSLRLAAFWHSIVKSMPQTGYPKISSIDKLLEVIVARGSSMIAGGENCFRALEETCAIAGSWRYQSGPIHVQSRRVSHLHTQLLADTLFQERDLLGIDEASWKIASARKPTEKGIGGPQVRLARLHNTSRAMRLS